jgi:hypothetical protein
MRYKNELILLFLYYLFLRKTCRIPATVASNIHTCILDNTLLRLCKQHFLFSRNINGILRITIEVHIRGKRKLVYS